MDNFERITLRIVSEGITETLYEFQLKDLSAADALCVRQMIDEADLPTLEKVLNSQLNESEHFFTLFVEGVKIGSFHRFDFPASDIPVQLKTIIDYIQTHNIPVASFGVKLTSVTFSDGTTVKPQGDEILVITGPNNSGKSQTLRDISFGLIGSKQQYNVVTELGATHFSQSGIIDYLWDYKTENTKTDEVYLDETNVVPMHRTIENGSIVLNSSSAHRLRESHDSHKPPESCRAPSRCQIARGGW